METKYPCPVCRIMLSTPDEVCYSCGGNEEGMLRQFFGANYHQDFLLDAVNPDEVVEGYVKENPMEHRILLSKAISKYLEKTSDDELSKKLHSDLGCYYRTEADGMSAREWLQKLAKQLVS